MMADENGECSNDLSRLVEKVVANDVVGLQELMKSRNLKTDAEDSSGMTLLQHAAFKGKLDICQFLFDLVKKFKILIFQNYVTMRLCNRVLIRMVAITSINILLSISQPSQGMLKCVNYYCNMAAKLILRIQLEEQPLKWLLLLVVTSFKHILMNIYLKYLSIQVIIIVFPS
jgi:ankyrin repeat protein